MFPLSIEGRIDTLCINGERVTTRLVSALTAVGARNVRSSTNHIEFNGGKGTSGLFGVGPVRILGRCHLGFDNGALSYSCSTTKTALIAGGMALFILVAVLSPAPNLNWPARAAFAIGTWLWLFGMNYWMTKTRFRRLLEQTLSDDHG